MHSHRVQPNTRFCVIFTQNYLATNPQSRWVAAKPPRKVNDMRNYTLIKAHLVEVNEFEKNQGYKFGSLIGSYIYKTNSHALAIHQCCKDFPAFDHRVCLEAMTIDVDDERYKGLHKIHEECGCLMEVCGW